MSPTNEPKPEPVDLYMRRREMDSGWERRLIRRFVAELESVDEIRAELTVRLTEAIEGGKRRDPDELREVLHLIGVFGNSETLDVLSRLANPDLHEDPQHIDLLQQKFLTDEVIRHQFFVTLGLLGGQLYNADADRIIPLMRLLRRGMADDYPEVRAAAAEAAGRSVKYHQSVVEHMHAAVPALIELVGDYSWEVQRSALRALSEFPDPRSVRALRNFLTLQRDERQRYVAWKGIQRIRDRGSRFRFLTRPANLLKDLLSKTEA